MNKLESYLMKHIAERVTSIEALENYAQTHRVPIMDPVSVNFLMQLIRIHKPTHILEIGTAIGYSALRMLEAKPDVNITTVEKNENMYELATQNIQLHNQASSIKVKHGDAIDVISDLVKSKDKFDFIFIDAAKAQYQKYFEAVQALTKDQTVIVCDNILFKGFVVDDTKVEQRRIRSLTEKIQQFNAWLVKQPNYHTSIVPIGDGLSISVKVK